MLDALLEAFSGPGAAFMYAITAILAFALAISLERGWFFWLKWRVDTGKVLAAVSSGNLDEASSLTEGHPVGILVKAGRDASPEAVWDSMGAKAAVIESEVRNRVPYLATIGNIATMLGLLGTVYGLILAFSGLGDASAAERTARLSEGIATAMSTTAWGLLVGIPALGLHAIYEAKANRLLAFCESVASEVAASRKK